MNEKRSLEEELADVRRLFGLGPNDIPTAKHVRDLHNELHSLQDRLEVVIATLVQTSDLKERLESAMWRIQRTPVAVGCSTCFETYEIVEQALETITRKPNDAQPAEAHEMTAEDLLDWLGKQMAREDALVVVSDHEDDWSFFFSVRLSTKHGVVEGLHQRSLLETLRGCYWEWRRQELGRVPK